MKIIGKTEDGFILQCTEVEIARILGYHDRSYIPANQLFSRKQYGNDIGTIIPVDEIWSRSEKIRYLPRTIDAVRAGLREIDEALSPVESIINPPIAAEPQQ